MFGSTITIDTQRLNSAAAALRRVTKEDKPTLVNDTAKFVALHAYKGTDKTTAAKIREELNEKRGRWTKAELIIAARSRRTGWGDKTVKQRARRFVAAKAQSAGWLKYGFIPAIRLFGGRAPQAKNFRRFPGEATKARRSIRRAVATISHLDRGFVERHPNLLQDSVNKQTRFMQRLAERKMRDAVRRSRR